MTNELAIDCDPVAMESIKGFAEAALPRETGGLLLGWWEPDIVIVKHAIEVPDPEATPTSWRRTEATAQHALDQALQHLAHAWLGYVGEWHSHPSPCPPSATDLAAIAGASRQFTEPLALLVYSPPGTISARAAHHGSLRATRGSRVPQEGRRQTFVDTVQSNDAPQRSKRPASPASELREPA
jgi:hypothetical protein